jgi:hypothetical protein
MLETVHFEVPELKLTAEEITELLVKYSNEESMGYHYSSVGGNLTNLLIVHDYKKTPLIERLEGLFLPDICNGSYFVSNYGSDRHIDDTRRCVISIELQNEHNIPVTYHIDEKEYDLYYNGKAVAIDVEKDHSSKTSPTKRVFFQFHLNEKHSFEEYREMYINKKMFRT